MLGLLIYFYIMDNGKKPKPEVSSKAVLTKIEIQEGNTCKNTFAQITSCETMLFCAYVKS